LQTHWQDPSTPIQEALGVLEKLKEEGKIRAIGASNCSLEDLKAYGRIASIQEKYSLLDRNIEKNGLLDWCRQEQIGVLAYSPLANGLLTGKIRPDRQFGSGDLRRANPRFRPQSIEQINAMLEQVRPIAAEHGVSIAQLVIAWTFSRPGLTTALCGARDAGQAMENAAAGDIKLSAEEIEKIGNLVHP
jgi:aryl-alcohol dehydrogenase-like predicted oxidoreductase